MVSRESCFRIHQHSQIELFIFENTRYIKWLASCLQLTSALEISYYSLMWVSPWERVLRICPWHVLVQSQIVSTFSSKQERYLARSAFKFTNIVRLNSSHSSFHRGNVHRSLTIWVRLHNMIELNSLYLRTRNVMRYTLLFVSPWQRVLWICPWHVLVQSEIVSSFSSSQERYLAGDLLSN